MAKKKKILKATNPIGKPPAEGSIKISQKDPDEVLFSKLNTMIEDSKNNRGSWLQNQEFWHKLRMRIRKEKTFPFEGASNLRLPTIEKYIRKIKAGLFTLFWGQTPKAVVIPEPTGNQDAAMKLEYYIDYLFEKVIKFSKPLIILIDRMLEKGFSFAEVMWRMEDEEQDLEINLDSMPEQLVSLVFSAEEPDQLIPAIARMFEIDMSESVRDENTEAIEEAIIALQAGDKKVKITVRDETYNNVEIKVHDPEFVYVPVDSEIHPKDARFIAIEFYEPWDVIKKKAGKHYLKEVIDEIDTFKDLPLQNTVPSQGKSALNDINHTTNITQDLREGIERINNASRSVKLFRMYAWYDLDGDGREERNVFIIAPEWKKVIAKFPYPHDLKRWPVARADAELTDNRWFSPRGVPELLDDIAREIDTQHNQKIDQQTIRNVPMFKFRSGLVNPKLVKFIPGQGIPVPGTVPLNDAVDIMRNESTAAEFSYRDEEMLLKTEVQELLGQVDYSLQSQINRREPRTATESSQQQQSANTVFGLDVATFSDFMSELMDLVLGLTQQYLPEEVYFNVVGEQAQVRLTREEIQGGYTTRIRGTDFTTSPAARVNNELNRIMFLTQNPVFLQAGILTPQNLFVLAKRYLQVSGDMSWQQAITPPQPQPQGPPPAAVTIPPNFDSLTDAEKSQVLQSAGVNPDMEGRALNKQQEIAAEMESSNGTGKG